jgi:predicted AAA+ superfamily ATPase
MFNRFIETSLVEALQHNAAVALLGPRQVGKTTLSLVVSEQQKALYLDLESQEDLVKLSDPAAFFAFHRDTLIVLDEIQRVPDLFVHLRGVIDKNRQQGRKNGQFLLLGSASSDLLRQSSESLAGRILYLEMGGFHALEIANTPQDRQVLWLRGGFPESYLADTDSRAMIWVESLIRTYLERDIPQWGFRVPAMRLRRLWTMLAHMQGEVLNFSKLAANLEIDGKTVRHYLDILADMLLVRRLEPWHENVKKRLVKSPRFYVRDSGVLHRLLGVMTYDALLSHPVLGKSFEGFVIENIAAVLPYGTESYFYRTAAGAEIDLVLKFPNADIWAIEIKHGRVPTLSKGFYQACEDIQASHRYVVYGGDDCFPIADGVMVMSLREMMLCLVAWGYSSS